MIEHSRPLKFSGQNSHPRVLSRVDVVVGNIPLMYVGDTKLTSSVVHSQKEAGSRRAHKSDGDEIEHLGRL